MLTDQQKREFIIGFSTWNHGATASTMTDDQLFGAEKSMFGDVVTTHALSWKRRDNWQKIVGRHGAVGLAADRHGHLRSGAITSLIKMKFGHTELFFALPSLFGCTEYSVMSYCKGQ